MKRRLPGILIGLLGIVFIATAVFTKLFSVAPAFERLTDDFRPELQASGLAQLREDLTVLSATQAEFTTVLAPQLAQDLGITPEQLSATLQTDFQAVATGLAAVPQIVESFDGVLTVLENERARFERADAIPTDNLPAETVPWALAGAGLLAIGAALLRPRRRGGFVAVGLGALLIVAPLVLTLPGKAQAADKMNSNLKPVYTAELVSGAKQSLATITAMGTELQTKMLPAVGQLMQATPDQVQAYLGKFPAVTAGLTGMPAALGRFNNLVGAFDNSLENYNDVKSTKLVPIVWILMVGGALIALIGAWTVAQGMPARATRKARVPAAATGGHKAG